ncbi:vacuole membrane protein 1 [Sabethes cyaneus]|uniref:vacuole membrane protein 1 n=1 Tax=Sabethes cyaneus TaxID=53552 RepID=UPI00237E1F5A|nr:vacuole membrane protein 1 [Sabethes cyaneus]
MIKIKEDVQSETRFNGAVSSTSSKSRNRKYSVKDKNLVLWRSPIKTSKYAGLEIISLINFYGKRLIFNRNLVIGLILFLVTLIAMCHVPGYHQDFIQILKVNGFFIIYWVGLGVLSSVGLGTGLHTFILYLGPHIASVTLAAYECNSLDFPEPPYPNEIICPDSGNFRNLPSIWNIMTKVRYEAFLWGAGTALGELPPYFMARASRLSAEKHETRNICELEKLHKRKEHGEKLSLFESGKLAMEKFVERVGFLGILLCASIPNPLFDLAGITCGHFLVPFWTFFGATLIGKAIIKMHIQKIFVIIAFNENLVEKAVDMLILVPVFGKILQEPFKSFLQNQKDRLHRGSAKSAQNSSNIIQKVFEFLVIVMICFFIVSIVNSLAQSYQKKYKKNKKNKTM